MERKPYEQVERERREDILARRPVTPKGACNYCGMSVPRGALWCSANCAKDHQEEKVAVLAQV